jgi:hypothetical protein
MWLLHAAVWQQMTNYVVVPDITIAQAFWGGDESKRPKDWHREIEGTLDTLMLMDWLTWIIDKTGRVSREGHWYPMSGYKAPYAKDPKDRAPRKCWDACPLHGISVEHGHYVVGVSPTFVGVLGAWELKRQAPRYAIVSTDKTPEEVLYGWASKRLDKDERKLIKGQDPGEKRKAPKSERTYTKIDLLPPVMLGASWAGLDSTQKRLLASLLEELTLVARKRKYSTDRLDGARIYVGGKPLRVDAKTKKPCPLLPEGKGFVCFGGNGKRPGGGYRIGGTPSKDKPGIRGSRRAGWLNRAEYYDVRPGPSGSRKAAARFLRDLRLLMELLDGVAVGYFNGEWMSLDQVERLAQENLQAALKVTIRPFGSEDYLELLEDYAKEKGGFSVIPRTQAQLEIAHREEVERRGGMLREDLIIKLERQMRGFKSAAQAQRFLSVHGVIHNLFRVGRHLLPSANHRILRARSFLIWHEVTFA